MSVRERPTVEQERERALLVAREVKIEQLQAGIKERDRRIARLQVQCLALERRKVAVENVLYHLDAVRAALIHLEDAQREEVL